MNKQTLGAVAAFAVLLIAFVATREKSVSVGVQKFQSPTLSSSAIESITVTGVNAALLERGANGWTVADPAAPSSKFPADDAQVQTLLTALSEFKASDFVSDKAEKHAEFEVTKEKGAEVTVKAGSTTVAIVFGKASKSGGTYVRKPDSNSVFSSASQVAWQLKRNVSAWRNKSIATAPAAEVTQVDVVRADGSTFSLKNADGSWALSPAPGFRVDSAVGQGLVSQLTSLTAQDFLATDGDFSKANVFTLMLKDGKTMKVTVSTVKRDDNTFALKVDGVAQQYLVASWAAEQLDKPVSGFRDLRLVDFDVTKATRLTITAAGKKTVVAKQGEQWSLVEPKSAPEFDGNQVVAQLNRLKGVRAAEVATSKPALKTTVIEVLVDGKPVQLAFGADVGDKAPVSGNLDSDVYLISNSERRAWETGAALFKKPPPPPDFGQMNGLDQLPPDIRAKLMQQLQQQQRN